MIEEMYGAVEPPAKKQKVEKSARPKNLPKNDSAVEQSTLSELTALQKYRCLTCKKNNTGWVSSLKCHAKRRKDHRESTDSHMALHFLNGVKKTISIEKATGQHVVAMFLENGGLPDYIEVDIFDPKDDKREQVPFEESTEESSEE